MKFTRSCKPVTRTLEAAFLSAENRPGLFPAHRAALWMASEEEFTHEARETFRRHNIGHLKRRRDPNIVSTDGRANRNQRTV